MSIYSSDVWRELLNDYELAYHKRQSFHHNTEDINDGSRLSLRPLEHFIRVEKPVRWRKRRKLKKPMLNLEKVSKVVRVSAASVAIKKNEDMPVRKWTGSTLLAFSRDVLPLLYSFLSLRSICVVSGVCRMWYKASTSPSFLDRIFKTMVSNCDLSKSIVNTLASLKMKSNEIYKHFPLSKRNYFPTWAILEAISKFTGWMVAFGPDLTMGSEWSQLYSRVGKVIDKERQYLEQLRRFSSTKLAEVIPPLSFIHNATTLTTFCLSPPHVRIWRQAVPNQHSSSVQVKYSLWILILHVAEPTKAEIFFVPNSNNNQEIQRLHEYPTFWRPHQIANGRLWPNHLKPECMTAIHQTLNLIALPINRRDIRRRNRSIRIAIYNLLRNDKLPLEVELPSKNVDVEMMQFRGNQDCLLFAVACNTGEVLVWEIDLLLWLIKLRWHLFRAPVGFSNDEIEQWRQEQIQNYQFLFHLGSHVHDNDAKVEKLGIRLRKDREIISANQSQSSALIADFQPVQKLLKKEIILEWQIIDMLNGRISTLLMPNEYGNVEEVAMMLVKTNQKQDLLNSRKGLQYEDILLVRWLEKGPCGFRNVRHIPPNCTGRLTLSNISSSSITSSSTIFERMSVDPEMGFWSVPTPLQILVMHVPTMSIFCENANYDNVYLNREQATPLQGPIYSANRCFGKVFHGGGISIRPHTNVQCNIVEHHQTIRPPSNSQPPSHISQVPTRPKVHNSSLNTCSPSTIVAQDSVDRYLLVVKDTGATILIDTHNNNNISGNKLQSMWKVGEMVSYDEWFYGVVHAVGFGEVKIRGAPLFADIHVSDARLENLQRTANAYDGATSNLLRRSLNKQQKDAVPSWSSDLESAKDRMRKRMKTLYGHFFNNYPTATKKEEDTVCYNEKKKDKQICWGEITVAEADPKLKRVPSDRHNPFAIHHFITFSLPDLNLCEKINVAHEDFAMTKELLSHSTLAENVQVKRVIGPIVVVYSSRFNCIFAIHHQHPAIKHPHN